MARKRNTPQLRMFPPIPVGVDGHIDNSISDEIVRYTDKRVRPDCYEYWEGHLVEIDGEKYLKPETANAIICENHDLRETMYMHECDTEMAAFDLFKSTANWSTADLKYRIKITANIIPNVFKERDIYNFMYSYMAKTHTVDFSECPASKSKLNWLWECGYLPILTMYLNQLEGILHHIRSLAPNHTRKLAQTMKNKLNSKGGQTAIKKGGMTGKPF